MPFWRNATQAGTISEAARDDILKKYLTELQKDNPVSYYALDNFAKLITIMAKDGLNLPNKWDETANEIKKIRMVAATSQTRIRT